MNVKVMGIGNLLDGIRGRLFSWDDNWSDNCVSRVLVFLYSPRMGEKSWFALNIWKYNLIAITPPFC